MAGLPLVNEYTWSTTVIDTSGGGFGQALQPDVRRAAIWFQTPSGAAHHVWVEPLSGGSAGFGTWSQLQPIILLARDWGPLIQQPWFWQGGGNPADKLFITQLFYISPPHSRGT